MKLSYREKIGLIVFLVLCIVIVFVAWPIKVLRTNIADHKAQKDEIQVRYDETQHLIAQIPTIEENIKKVYTDSKGLSEPFTISRGNFEIDRYISDMINKAPYKAAKNALVIEGNFAVSSKSDSELPFYYYSPSVLVYPILEAADTNGNLLETTDRALYDKVTNALSMKTLEAQKIELHTATVEMKFTKEALLALEDELKKSETGVRITSVTIEDYDFGALSEIPEDSGYSKGSVNFEFYTMQQIQEPKFED